MLVKNVAGTSDLKCKCDSWLAHWSKYANEPIPRFCYVKNCTEKAEVGGHVKAVVSFKPPKVYIVPLCHGHNQSVENFHIPDYVTLISADMTETCGK